MYRLNKFISVFLIISIILSGCMVGPDFKEPEIDNLPDEFRFSDDNDQQEVNLVWWELFNDPVLVSLVNTALENNKDLLIAISRIEEARSFLVFTRADQYPRLDLQGGANKGNFNGGIITSDPDEPNNSAFISPVRVRVIILKIYFGTVRGSSVLGSRIQCIEQVKDG